MAYTPNNTVTSRGSMPYLRSYSGKSGVGTVVPSSTAKNTNTVMATLRTGLRYPPPDAGSGEISHGEG
ncbi:hypothetical protein GCM10007977_074910 [Dactylosporangium sucinum]|uniref:Uncharacterized protein n=1 Tax=Dactylosporangium sucinum TaxID=1424081 RepID=A0A917U6H3_9ACTN|nr:hypothetical protein GCM10007977_074910 [Dactylosporangium sucinum]